MPIPKSVATDSNKMGEKNDCAVVAVAILTNTPYPDVHKVFTRLGRKQGGRTSFRLVFAAITALGCHVSPAASRCYAKTVKGLPAALPRGRFLVETSGHVLALVDGKVLDWTEGRRHRPRRFWEVSL